MVVVVGDARGPELPLSDGAGKDKRPENNADILDSRSVLPPNTRASLTAAVGFMASGPHRRAGGEEVPAAADVFGSPGATTHASKSESSISSPRFWRNRRSARRSFRRPPIPRVRAGGFVVGWRPRLLRKNRYSIPATKAHPARLGVSSVSGTYGRDIVPMVPSTIPAI